MRIHIQTRITTIVLAGAILACSLAGAEPPSEEAIETSMAVIRTQTAAANPSPTRIHSATPTATLQPTKTPSSSPTPSPVPGEELFRDDFSGAESVWYEVNDREGRIHQADGVLSVLVKVPDIFLWSELGENYSDVTIEVDVALTEGPLDSDFGVMCRLTDRRSYQFWISGDGFYSIDLWEAGDFTSLKEWTRSSAINRGRGMQNHITASCLGNQFILSVNGQHLTTVSDDTYTEGDIGLAVGAYENAGVTVHFDNVLLTGPAE